MHDQNIRALRLATVYLLYAILISAVCLLAPIPEFLSTTKHSPIDDEMLFTESAPSYILYGSESVFKKERQS